MRYYVGLVAAVCLLSAGPVSAQAAKGEVGRAALLKTDAEWVAAASTRDLERIVSYWTDDAVIYPPHQVPVVGKAAIRQFVGDSLKLPGFSVIWKPVDAVVSRSSDIGYTMGTNTFTFPNDQGGVTTSHGRYITTWRREADGRWRCVVDFWNEAPPAPTASPQK